MDTAFQYTKGWEFVDAMSTRSMTAPLSISRGPGVQLPSVRTHSGIRNVRHQAHPIMRCSSAGRNGQPRPACRCV